MTDMTLVTEGGPARAGTRADLYRAVWRWHFYAGLLVLPFLITLSVTGALYLFRDELDAIVHADLKHVEASAAAPLASPSAMVWAALDAHPGVAAKYTDPPTADSSAEIIIDTLGGERLAVYVDPYTGAVLGAMADRGTIMWTVRTLHSLSYFGPVARGLVEIAAGWSILLVGTGIFLWWPRGRKGGVLSIRGTPGKRLFWRDTHAVTGILVGGFIAFLAVTGMPWSQVWGGKVNEWANGSNFGYPAGVRTDIPMSDAQLSDGTSTSWSLEQARLPLSPAPGGAARAIDVSQAVAELRQMGMHPGFTVSIPASAAGVYTGSVYPDDLSRQRVIHLDQYSGRPLLDMSYADYGALGRALEFGINVHMGQQFGLANKLVLLAACAGIVLLSVSAGVMWWKRRPAGTLGVPPMPRHRGAFNGVLAILIAGGIVFPLVGASLVTMLMLDWLLNRRFSS